MLEWLGWTATAVFTGSYLCRDTVSLRRVQMAGAVLWVIYGIFLQARPVVAANLLVLGGAAAASWRERRNSVAA